MYQIYNQPTKFPLCQGQVVRKYREVHDREMKKTMQKQHSAIDDQMPSHFPLRFSTHSRRVTEQEIKRQNKRIVDSLLRATSDSTLRASAKQQSDKRNKFRRRKWAVYNSTIHEQNVKMFQRIKNVKGMVIRDKNDVDRRKRYFQNRRRAQRNDIFANPSPSKSSSKHKAVKFPPINSKSNPTQRHSASASSSTKENVRHHPKAHSMRKKTKHSKVVKPLIQKKAQRVL